DGAVGSSGNAAGVDEQIVIPVLAPGDYIIGVDAYDPGVPSNTTYKLHVLAAPKVLRYNVYGATGTVTPSAATFFGTAGGDATSFTVLTAPPAASFVVTAVIG